MTKSREELVALALAIVGGDGGSGQSPAAEDHEFVNELVPSVLDELSKRGIYNYGDPDQIDEDAFIHLATIIANSVPVAARFTASRDFEAALYAESKLREIAAEPLSYQPQQTEYF